MIVTQIKLTNLRAIETATFRFQPGFNLIVGVNGVGKTSVLDALGVCLSAATKHLNQLRLHAESFNSDDIRIGSDALSVQCGIRLGKTEYTYLVHKPREASAPHEKGTGKPREQVHETPERNEFLGDSPEAVRGDEKQGRPLALLFSTNRAVPSDRSPTKRSASGGFAAAYADAFSNRELRLAEFAAWMRVQEALKNEQPAAKKVLAAFERAVKRFLPGYSKLRVEGDGRPRLVINHGKTTLDVRQLSDGERGTLALVLDLTRRLAQANPEMNDPAKKVEAIVLIDEIDLHLHPKWQRQIVPNLTEAFPKCQFIATTHSPQVIAEVEPERVILMRGNEVIHADRTLGMDSNWILKHVMEGDDRPSESVDAIAEVEALIQGSSFKKARTRMADYREQGLDLTEWSVLEARIARLEVLGE